MLPALISRESIRAGTRSRPALLRCRRCVIESSARIAAQPCDPSVHHTRSRGGHAMRSRFRPSFVLTTLVVLFVGVSGAAAPVGRAANPTNTKVAGIDVDA